MLPAPHASMAFYGQFQQLIHGILRLHMASTVALGAAPSRP
jgi:hypothetical protein